MTYHATPCSTDVAKGKGHAPETLDGGPPGLALGGGQIAIDVNTLSTERPTI
ncbi:MAG TPA: hypothetical protein VIJ40_01925 [Acidimicrobiales bacterium]